MKKISKFVVSALKAKGKNSDVAKYIDTISASETWEDAFKTLSGEPGFGFKNAYLFEKSVTSRIKNICGNSTHLDKISETVDSKDKAIFKLLSDAGYKDLFEVDKHFDILSGVKGIGSKKIDFISNYLDNFF